MVIQIRPEHQKFFDNLFVRAFGWAAYDPFPGCLDYREKKYCRKAGKVCQECEMFYPEWRGCFLKEYRPGVVEMALDGIG
jgi:hypothetical protein